MKKVELFYRWVAFKLTIQCWLWDKRGLTICPYHGFHAQSWFTGYCKECKEIPSIPQMEDICCFCNEEKAIKQIASPNRDKHLWSICWECDKFIDWSQKRSLVRERLGENFPEFSDWLFETEQVYPKHSHGCISLVKK